MHDLIFGDGKVVGIATDSVEDDRGLLTAVDFRRYNFQPVRAFLVTAPSGTTRGGHGHRRGRQLLMHVSGEIEIEVHYAERSERLALNATNRALMIEAPVWSRQVYRGDNPAMIVFCDTPYDADNYVTERVVK